MRPWGALSVGGMLLLAGVAAVYALAGAGDVSETEMPTGVLAGLCEASAIVRTGDGYLVGDNETEDRLHAFTRAFQPMASWSLSSPVEDIEALALGNDGLLVVGSQGASKKGKRKPDRELVLLDGHPPVRPDLSACAECEAARPLPPKEGGLSVEGAAFWAGRLWFGVRSPAPRGKALLLGMDGTPTTELRTSERVELDLDGFGVRDLTTHEGALLVLAGPVDGRGGPHRVWVLDRPEGTPTVLPIELPSGAEGIVIEEGALVVVTDGDGQPGKPCKEPARWVRMPMPVAPTP